MKWETDATKEVWHHLGTNPGIVQDHLCITAIQIIVGIPITEMTIETIVGTIIVEAEILTEIPIAEITIMMGGIEVEGAEGEEVCKNRHNNLQ